MYLSAILINTGTNADRPRPGRFWLRNAYHVHQRLCMAFPSVTRKNEDPTYQAPYAPADFAGQVHVPRGAEGGFLFRIEPQGQGRAVVLVQSAVEPDWEYAFLNARHLLAASPQVKVFAPQLEAGERLRFRLRANPTRKLSRGRTGKPTGLRVGLYTLEEQLVWLERKAEAGGFRLITCEVIAEGQVMASKPHTPQDSRMRLLSVLYDGTLEVGDPEILTTTLQAGLGSGKAFGFGLLSVARGG